MIPRNQVCCKNSNILRFLQVFLWNRSFYRTFHIQCTDKCISLVSSYPEELVVRYFEPNVRNPQPNPYQKLKGLADKLTSLCFCPCFMLLEICNQFRHRLKSLVIELNHEILHTCYVQGTGEQSHQELRT